MHMNRWNRVTLATRIDVYVSTGPYLKTDNWVVDHWRNTAGTKLENAKGSTFDRFYLDRPDCGKPPYNRTFRIIGLDCDFDFKVGGTAKRTAPNGTR